MKKVLSFVLVLALVLSSFSMAFAGETATNYTQLTDIDGIANEEAVEVCNNLGIVTGNPDGTFQPEKTVNRAEFAAMITRALGIPESALAGYTATSFKDTNGYGWAVPYLAFCESKGIMLGDGAGNAMPGKTINTNEAVTMVLRAIGYTANSSELVGTWPANYVTKAQDLGIYDDVSAVATVDKANAAQMIYNSLTVAKVAVSSDGKTEYVKDAAGNGTSMLTAGLNCSLDTAGADANGRKVVVYTEDSIINVMPHVGEYAKVYLNEDDDIVAIADVDSVVLTGTFKTQEDAGAPLNGVTFCGSDDIDYKITDTTTVASLFLNNDVADKDDLNVTNGAAKMLCDDDDAATYTLNVKTSGKTITNIYSIERVKADAAAQVTKDDLADIATSQKLLGYEFDTDKNDNIIENSFELIGAKSLDDIKADDVVYVYHDNSTNKLITRVEVGTQVIEGTISKTNSDKTKVTVNGETYKYASLNVAGQSGIAGDLDGAKNAGNLQAGDSVKLYLDAQGYIYDYDKTAGSADTYAVVINVGETSSSTMDTDTQIKMMTADGNVKTYITDIDDFDVTSFGAMGITAGSIIKYSLDKDGEVDDIASGTDEIVNGVITPHTDWQVDYIANADVNKDGYYGGLEINSDAIIFTADVSPNFNELGTTASALTTDKDNYDVTTAEKLKGTDDVEAFYVIDEDGNIECMIVNADATAANDIFGVVTDKYISTDADGDKVYMLTTIVDGKVVEYQAKSQSVWDNFDYTTFYEFTTNSSNELDGNGGEVANTGVSNGAFDVKTSYQAITVTSASALSINGKVVKVDADNNGTVDATFTLANNAVVYSYDTKDDEFQVKTMSSLKNDITKTVAGNDRELMFFIPDTDDSLAPSIVVLFNE